MLVQGKKFVPFIIFIILAIFLWRGLYLNPHHVPSPLINKPVPEFKATALESDQEIVTNADLQGHITLLNIFATWCSVCQEEHGQLMQIKPSNLVRLVGVDYKDNRVAAQQWLASLGNPYQIVIFDPQGQFGIDLGVYGTPETFLIDQNGIIRDKFIGAITNQLWLTTILPEIKKLSVPNAA